jgi:beta-mannanase
MNKTNINKFNFKYLLLLIPLLIITTIILFIPSTTKGNGLDHDNQPLSTEEPNSQLPIQQVANEATNTNVFIPLVRNGMPTFYGIMMPIYWTKENVAEHMPVVDALAGIKHTSVGWGIDVQDPALYEPWQSDSELNRNNLYRQLEQLWQQGYVSFIKIGSSTTIREIADGYYDDRLNQMAQIYKRWLENGDGRKAMFGPFQEMNGEWVPYYLPNTNPQQKHKDFKDAYRRIYDVFTSNGISRSQIWWVFSPNGWSWPDDNFEYYYPGDDLVDLVGFAAYNFGFCEATLKPDGNDYGNWENYDRIFEPYIRRMQIIAPTKPILITETGTSALTSTQAREQSQYDYGMKAEWFRENYNYLAKTTHGIGNILF